MGGELLGFTARLLFGPLWEGAPAGAGGGESLDLFKALGSGMALSLRRFAPPPSQREALCPAPAGFYFIVEIFAEIGYTIL